MHNVANFAILSFTYICNQKEGGHEQIQRHRTHTGTRPTPLATTTAFLMG
jgi:hypothetical protein